MDLLMLILTLATLHTSQGLLTDIYTSCCVEGIKWSTTGGRCSSFSGDLNVTAEDMQSCMAIVEVCCMKEVHIHQCEAGKDTALKQDVCIIRDTDPGAEQYMECCHCCSLGLVARRYRLSCNNPGYGEPCDTMFEECCTGRSSERNITGGTRPGGQERNDGVRTGPGVSVTNDDADDDDDFEDDLDECTLFPGQLCSHLCVNTPGSFRCECGDSRLLVLDKDGRTCRSINEEPDTGIPVERCADSNPCEHLCVDTIGGKECQCNEGFRLNDDQRTCRDIDECLEGIARCGRNEECVNVMGRYTCRATGCQEGYVRNPSSGRCEQKIECPQGYGFNSITRRCEDLNECALGTYDCGPGRRCENTMGSYVCRRVYSCGTGYTLDTLTQRCVDTDECRLGIHNCGQGYDCQNTNGSFRCVPKQCPDGYQFNKARGECERIICRRGFRPGVNGNCIDINECTEFPNVCGQYKRCSNSVGSYTCRSSITCLPGFEPNDVGRCVDVDECEKGIHRCGSEQQCVNRQGSYFCQCPRGYRHDSAGRCSDVDECAFGAAICPSTSTCVNTPGSYTCSCKEGMQDDGQDQCQDVNECLTPNICHHTCVNVEGSYFCSCNRGYQLAKDRRVCEDINECTQFGGRGGERGGVCGGRCVNLQGSYRCECPDGWRLKADGRSCEDIDECKDGSAFCPQRDGFCVNVRGGYKCPVVRCPEGFVKVPSGGRQNSELIADDGGVVCGRSCRALDVDCHYNKTKTVSWQFLSLPTIEFINEPLTVLNIKTIGYSIYPNLHLEIIGGNDTQLFATMVQGDRAWLKLLKPLYGPSEYEILLKLENRDFSGRVVISRHITHAKIYVAEIDPR